MYLPRHLLEDMKPRVIERIGRYATLAGLDASDNPVEVPPRPEELKEAEDAAASWFEQALHDLGYRHVKLEPEPKSEPTPGSYDAGFQAGYNAAYAYALPVIELLKQARDHQDQLASILGASIGGLLELKEPKPVPEGGVPPITSARFGSPVGRWAKPEPKPPQ